VQAAFQCHAGAAASLVVNSHFSSFENVNAIGARPVEMLPIMASFVYPDARASCDYGPQRRDCAAPLTLRKDQANATYEPHSSHR
jgi:hypothetical protein